MRDAAAIARALAALSARRAPYFVATVVRVRGSSYRRPGARLVATGEGRVAGSISGGCLERDLVRTGAFRARNGPVLVTFDSRDLEDGEPALGCGGVVDVLIERGVAGSDDDPLALVATALAAEEPVVLATAFRSTDASIAIGARWAWRNGASIERDRPGEATMSSAIESSKLDVVAADRAACLEVTTEGGVVDLLIEPVVPAPHLAILGEGADVEPLVAAAARLGWRVTVWSASGALDAGSKIALAGAAIERDLDVVRARLDAAHRAAAVVMGHHLGQDRRALDAALASRAFYVGVLGPRHRTEKLAAEIAGAPLEDPRLRAPIGVDLGAETPDEIALAITAEILAALRGASLAPLRERPTIHGDRR